MHPPHEFLGAPLEYCAAYIARYIRIRVCCSAFLRAELALTKAEWCIAFLAPPYRPPVLARQAKMFDVLPDSLSADAELTCYLGIGNIRVLLAQF